MHKKTGSTRKLDPVRSLFAQANASSKAQDQIDVLMIIQCYRSGV